MKKSNETKVGMKEIFCRFIRRKGKIVYPKNSKFFHFYVPDIKVVK